MIAIWNGGSQSISSWAQLSALPAEQRAEITKTLALYESHPSGIMMMADVNGRAVIVTGLGLPCDQLRQAEEVMNPAGRAELARKCSGAVLPPKPPRATTVTRGCVGCKTPGAIVAGVDAPIIGRTVPQLRKPIASPGPIGPPLRPPAPAICWSCILAALLAGMLIVSSD